MQIMSNPKELAQQGPFKEKTSLPKEELNRSAQELTEGFKKSIRALEEFQNALKKKGRIDSANFLETGSGSLEHGASFYKGESHYRVYYQESLNWALQANDTWFSVEKMVQETNGDIKSYCVNLGSRTPVRRFVPGGAEVRYSVTNFPLGEVEHRVEDHRNTYLAVEKAREMLKGLSPQK